MHQKDHQHRPRGLNWQFPHGNFHKFWWIYVFSRVYLENRQGGPICQSKSCLSAMKPMWKDCTTLQKATHQSKPWGADMWGRLAPPAGRPAHGTHLSVSASNVGSPPPLRSNLRRLFKSFWSEGSGLTLQPIYISPYTTSLSRSQKP